MNGSLSPATSTMAADDQQEEDTMPADPLAAVRTAGEKLARKQAERDAAMRELTDAIRAADSAGGVTRKELIEASGLARQSVYDALRKQPTA